MLLMESMKEWLSSEEVIPISFGHVTLFLAIS